MSLQARTIEPGVEHPSSSASPSTRTRSLRRRLRCRLLPETDGRLGKVAFVGLVPQIPGDGPWVGIALDEPTGKNDGSVGDGTKYFDAGGLKHGIFVRPERVEIGDFEAEELGSDMEEM